MIHTVKGFSRVNEAEIDVFLELFCFFFDPTDVSNLILFPLTFLNPACASGSSQFMYCWSLAWRILRITLLVGSQAIPGVTGKFGLGETKWSRAKANRILPREHTGHKKDPLPTTQKRTLLLLLSHFSRVRLSVTPMDHGPVGSSVHAILQARILSELPFPSPVIKYEVKWVKWRRSVVSDSLRPHGL